MRKPDFESNLTIIDGVRQYTTELFDIIVMMKNLTYNIEWIAHNEGVALPNVISDQNKAIAQMAWVATEVARYTVDECRTFYREAIDRLRTRAGDPTTGEFPPIERIIEEAERIIKDAKDNR